ncbi:CarD family transcriptional regulator [Bartonella sp. CB175]|uniref:CarD family transcriptional regulator n=1 Tax=Bartonella sp. CB175 TaxID=3112256 RepID=UPI00300E4BCC
MASQYSTSSSDAKGFSTFEYIVYPTHGVGQIIAIEDQEVAGHKLKLFVIHFAKDKMDVKVPIAKAISVGMRKLSAVGSVERALKILQGKARVKRTMWSRRAQEYDAKINSGDLISIAEVVRDLFRSDMQPEQSYSERQLYTAALERMAREIAVINSLSETETINLIEMHLSNRSKREFKTDIKDTNANSNTIYAA